MSVDEVKANGWTAVPVSALEIFKGRGQLSPPAAITVHDVMSFDIYGGIKAMEVLKILGSTHDQAEAVAEAIIRHQDLGVDGTITFIGQLIQLATIYDNVGEYEGIEDFGSLVHEATRDEVNKAFPRLYWSNCFADTVRREESSKPWCHTTHIPQFEEKIKANALHKKWE
ncbi:hypothetical protein N0V95_004760 [Ascochyta clinopodiicola]|nr:hypothetical protein N0V95_004760 [Ascochyta clinopodiicola]